MKRWAPFPKLGRRGSNRGPRAIQRAAWTESRQDGAGGRLAALLALSAFALTMARAVARETTDVAVAAGHTMTRLKAAKATTLHPSPESHDALLTPRRRRGGGKLHGMHFFSGTTCQAGPSPSTSGIPSSCWVNSGGDRTGGSDGSGAAGASVPISDESGGATRAGVTSS